MPQPKIMPGGEQLPQYDDEPSVSPGALLAWLRERRADLLPVPSGLDDVNRSKVDWAHREVVLGVLQALQAVGDATLVKNATYRAMVRDGRDIERIGAALHRIGAVGSLLEHDGDVADTAIDGLERARAAADAEIERRRNDVP